MFKCVKRVNKLSIAQSKLKCVVFICVLFFAIVFLAFVFLWVFCVFFCPGFGFCPSFGSGLHAEVSLWMVGG